MMAIRADKLSAFFGVGVCFLLPLVCRPKRSILPTHFNFGWVVFHAGISPSLGRHTTDMAGFGKSLFGWIILWSTLSGGTLVLGQTPPPNIVVFLADDMGLGDTSAYQDLTGNPNHYQVDTPNLSRLAAMGTRFTDVHSGSSLCTATRLSLLTGTHSFRSALKQNVSYENQDNIGTLLAGTRSTFAHKLQNAGYGTYGVGKWHVAMQADFSSRDVFEGPVQSGFHRYTGTPGNFPGDQGMIHDSQLVTYDSNFNLVPFDDPDAIAWDPDNNADIARNIQQTNLSAAQQYLSEHVASQPSDPFMLYYASHSNHTPYVGPNTLNGQVVDGYTVNGTYLDVPTTTDGNGNIIPDGPDYGDVNLERHWEPYLETDQNGNVIKHGPGERLGRIDENDIAMGQLLDYLEQTDDPRNPGFKLIDNTLVVFTSDNGSDLTSEPSVGALPQNSDGVITDIRGKKATQWEGGTRVPFIAAWANRIAEGETSDALFGLNDLYATFAAVADTSLNATEAVDSENVLSALTGDATGAFRDSMLVYKTRHRLILRDGDLKLVINDADYNEDYTQRFNGNLDFADLTTSQLFDLSTDLGETNNLLSDPAYASRISQMLATAQSYVDQGYTRNGAMAVMNGRNFQGGGSILDPSNYQYYGDGTQFQPGTLTNDNPSFVFRDGNASTRVSNAWIIQGNGTVTFDGTQAGLQVNSRYELRGGTLVSQTDFQVNNGSNFRISGGVVDLAGEVLRFNRADGLVEFYSGEINARRLSFADYASSTDGSKVFRFANGLESVFTLTSAINPIVFGDDGSLFNDFIDFESGSLGQLVTTEDALFFESLWAEGKLRLDGFSGETLLLQFSDVFSLSDDGNGFSSLSLRAVPEPGTFTLVGLSLLLLARTRRRTNAVV